MHKTISVILIGVLMICFWCGAALAEEKKKSPWYIGFGVGLGNLEIEGETLDDMYGDNPYIDVGPEITFNFGVGAIINPKLHLGLDISAIRQSAEDDFNQSLDFQINNYFAALSYYPIGKGFFIKAGAGISVAVIELDSVVFDDSESYTGTGYLLGIGYDFWLGKTFNLGIHAEYSKQTYDDNDAPEDTDFTSIYISFYWF